MRFKEAVEEFIKTTNVDNILKHLKRPSSQYSKVFKIYDKDKNVTYQQLDFVYMDYNSKQILITYTDITKSLQKERETNAKLKKALKEVKKANEAKSEFLSRMSHDMRTPMNGIIGLTDILLADNTVTDTVRKKLLEMKEAEDLLLSLVNDILDMQKIESNKFVLSNHFYPFIDIIKNIHMSTNEEKFVGHIGGDDFVAIVGGMECEQICQNIVAEFDREVVKYFTPEDVEKGYLEVPNRKGIIEQYPITTISVSAVVVDAGRFHNALEIGEVAAQVKHLAKITPGSTYVIDRRKK